MFFNEAIEVVLQLKKYFKRYWREKLLSNCCTRVNTARESEWTWKSQMTKHSCYSQKYPPQTKPPHTHLVLWIRLSLCYKICFDIRSNILSLQLCKALSSFCFTAKPEQVSLSWFLGLWCGSSWGDPFATILPSPSHN